MPTTNGLDFLPTLKGVTDSRYTGKVTHYRGIQYARISERFAKPVLNEEWPGKDTDCTRFGPRCPQPPIDVRDLMQIPKNLPQNDTDEEDELRCANLNVTCPSDSRFAKLPVLLWIYGGALMRTFGSASQKIGDPGPIVAQSIEQGKPFILVTIHYRLNVLGFGDGNGEVNLCLQDQRASIAWVKRYISGFGGDPNNITLGGESAGAVCTHALLASGSNADIQRAILVSGSLYTTPPQPERRCDGMVGLVEGNLQIMEMEKGNMNPGESPEAFLAGASVGKLTQTLQDLDVTSMWMWQEAALKHWENSVDVFGKLKGVMVGDVEYESVLWERGIPKLSGAKIVQCFDVTPASAGERLKHVYGVQLSDQRASRQAVFDFLNDARFAYSAHLIAKNIHDGGGRAYQYYFDQVNPFAKPGTARAHHAVDLFPIFGGYDGFINEEMKHVGRVLREKWISFINGEEPWNKEKVFAFGPSGLTNELTKEESMPRRRHEHFAVLEDIGHETIQQVVQKLSAAIGSATSS